MNQTSDLQPSPSEPESASDSFVPESRWPMVLGTISILYASFGILFMLITLAGVFLGPWLQASLGGMDPISVPTALLVGQSLLAILGLGLGIVLLTGGILTIMRRRRGPRLISVWVVGRLVLIVLGMVFAFSTMDVNLEYQERVQEAVVEQMRKNEIPEERIEASAPGQGMNRRSMVTWTLAFGGILSIYPIIAGLMVSGREVRSEYRLWP